LKTGIWMMPLVKGAQDAQEPQPAGKRTIVNIAVKDELPFEISKQPHRKTTIQWQNPTSSR
jgi:hypothetical protein